MQTYSLLLTVIAFILAVTVYKQFSLIKSKNSTIEAMKAAIFSKRNHYVHDSVQEEPLLLLRTIRIHASCLKPDSVATLEVKLFDPSLAEDLDNYLVGLIKSQPELASRLPDLKHWKPDYDLLSRSRALMTSLRRKDFPMPD